MMITLKLVIFLSISVTAATFTCKFTHIIHVNTTGSSNESCWTGPIPCDNINLALKGMKKFSNCTILKLYSGSYFLKSNDSQFLYRSHIAFIGLGNNSESVIINCDSLTGLSFLWSEYINFSYLTLHGCGGVEASGSRNLTSQSFKLLAVYMLFCKNVIMNGVHIESSGMALYNTVGTVVITNSSFVKSGKRMNNGTCGGGGLLIQFTYCAPKYNCSGCNHSDVNPEYVSSAEYSITNTLFLSNVANYDSSLLYKASNQHGDTHLCGRGGGLLIAFQGTSRNNNISFQNVTFQDNKAHQGAGMFLAFFDNASDNFITVANMNASNNYFHDIDRWTTDGGGGALKIEFSGIMVQRNHISLSSMTIKKNRAPVGGGLFMSAICERNMEFYDFFTINEIKIVNFTFDENMADVGAAAYFVQRRTCIQVVRISIANSTFSSNSLTCSGKAFSFATRSCSGVIYINSISINFSGKLTFSNNNAAAIEGHDTSVNFKTPTLANFSNNSGEEGAALALYDCSVVVLNPLVILNFNNNIAVSQGGAVYSGLCHSNNQPTSRSSQCFIQYSDENVHPDKWNTSLTFNNNTPNSLYVDGAIACWWPKLNSSIITHEAIESTFCWNSWSYGSGSCATSVRTSPALLKTTNDQNNPFLLYPGEDILLPVKVFDGQQNVVSYDDLKVDVCIKSGPCAFNDVWNSTSEILPLSCKSFSLHEKVILYSIAKNCNNMFNSLLHLSIVLGNLHADVVLQFKTCPNNFLPNSKDFCTSKDCFFTKCTWKFTEEITCDDTSRNCNNDKLTDCGIASEVYARPGHCFSLYHDQNNKTHLIVGQCPLLYGTRNVSVGYSSIQSVIDDNYNLCVNTGKSVYGNALSHHTGRLCGDCVDGAGVPLNSIYLECTESLGRATGLVLFVFVELFPVTIMIAVIIVFNVKLTGGSIGGYVLFSQLISLSFAGHVYPIQVSDIISDHINEFSSGISWNTIFIPYHLWNLNFLPLLLTDGIPVCITNSMKPLGAIAFWYVVAFYPILMLLLLYIWIYMYENGFRLVGVITRPIHHVLARLWQMFNITPSLMDSIASIYILCVTQFTSISLKLLHFTSWKSLKEEDTRGLAFYYDGSLDYFGWRHGLVATFGILVLFFLVFLPMLYLLFHPFQWCQRLLDRLRLRREIVTSLSDIFTGAFKNGSSNSRDYRHVAGLYLFIRVHIICMYYIPYSKEDILLFALLSTTIVFGGMVTIFRPFKSNIDNFSNFLLFMILAILSFPSNSLVSKYSVSKLVDACTLTVMLLPLCSAFFFCLYWIYVKFRFCIKYHVDRRVRSIDAINSETMNEENEVSDDSSTFYPDRILNPQNYNERHYQYTQLTPALSTCETVVTGPSTCDSSTPLLGTVNDTSRYGSLND